MKVSQILIVGLLSASCSDDVTIDRQENLTADQPAATTGEQAAPAPTTTPNAPAQSAAGQPKAGPPANADAAILHDFKQRIDAYMKLRKEAVKGAPKLKETKDADQIKLAQDSMSNLIRAARDTAKQGDIYTPEITAKFRRLLSPELKGDDGRDAKAIIKDDAPTNVTFKVNAKYPEGAPVPTVPASLLVQLPQLPEPLQYRIIDKHLVLVDEDADVIVDYALNVIR